MTKLQKNLHKSLGKTGFTLIELLVVMAILGILIAVAIAGVGIAQRGARDNTRTRDLVSIKQSLEDYYGANRAYPSTTALSIGSSSYSLNGNTVNLNQSGASTVTISYKQYTGSPTSGCVPTDFGTKSNPGTWYLAYNVNSTSTAYMLCAYLENGTVINQGN